MKFLYYTALSAALCALLSPAAHADYLKVYSPHIEKGELSAEVDLNHNTDHRDDQNGYLSQVVGMEYGVNDYWMTELAAEIEKDPNANDKLTNIKFENIIAPFKQNELPIDAALYVELEKSAVRSEPNNFEVKALLEKDISQFKNIANIGVSHTFGNNSANDIQGSASFRTAYKLDPKFEPGLEYYANFGDLRHSVNFKEQEHQVGPVVQGKIGHVKYDTGFLFGVSDAAADTTAKLNLEYEF